ncbi:MAG TPA: type II secretion system F family protein [Solimonas sp.]|nr:type II secretion system F family protein [Solimonas sp.]
MTVSVLVFLLAVALVVGAAWLFVRAGQHERQEDMLLRARASGSFVDDGEAPASLKVGRQISNPLLRGICHLVWRTGVELEPPTILRILLVLTLLGPVALLAFGVFAGLIIMSFLLLFGWLILTRRAAMRRNKIIEQLPNFLESAIRVLSAGNTLEESLAAAARESPDPIRPLFVSVGRQVRLGAPIETVLQEAADIHKISDLKVLALAASVNRKFGGSLRNILRSLIQAIRMRDMAARELRALTAETRFSAMVLCIIPILLVLFIVLRNPGYYNAMWLDPGGRGILVGSVVMQILGIAVIFRMMRSVEDR